MYIICTGSKTGVTKLPHKTLKFSFTILQSKSWNPINYDTKDGGINIKKSMEFDMTRQFSFTVHCFKILYLSFIPAHILKFHFQVIKKTHLNKTKFDFQGPRVPALVFHRFQNVRRDKKYVPKILKVLIKPKSRRVKKSVLLWSVIIST